MTPHPNFQVAWDEIACARGHDTHETRRVTVNLGGPTPYHDYCPIPVRFAREFVMDIYPPDLYPIDGSDYCPAHDAVSETIVSHGVWEPRETTLALTVCDGHPDELMLDFGAQLGWFSFLAASCGLDVDAFDADPENLRVLQGSAAANGWSHRIETHQTRVGPDTPVLDMETVNPHDVPIRLVKIDTEGAERDVLRILWPAIETGLVDHLLVEVSPCFADYYPQLVTDLVDAGYRAFLLPPKSQPPVTLDDPEQDLVPYQFYQIADRDGFVSSLVQEDCWFAREGASW